MLSITSQYTQINEKKSSQPYHTNARTLKNSTLANLWNAIFFIVLTKKMNLQIKSTKHQAKGCMILSVMQPSTLQCLYGDVDPKLGQKI
jgi:hypothetical protein